MVRETFDDCDTIRLARSIRRRTAVIATFEKVAKGLWLQERVKVDPPTVLAAATAKLGRLDLL